MDFLKKKYSTGRGDILEVRSLKKSFNGQVLFHDMSFGIGSGGKIGLIGSNGSGKTSLLNILFNFTHADNGTVHFEGRSTVGLPSSSLARLGLSRSFQISKNIDHLSVCENLLLCGTERWRYQLLNAFFGRKKIGHVQQRLLKDFSELFNFLGVDADTKRKFLDPTTLAKQLSFGEQQIVELARLLLSDASVYLLDEPTTHLNALANSKLADLINLLSEQGKGFLIISHDARFLLKTTESIVLLSPGKAPFMDSTPNYFVQHRSNEAVTSGPIQQTGKANDRDDALLNLENLHVGYNKNAILKDINLNVRRAEIVSFTGKNGCGKSTILKTIIGLQPAISGLVRFEGIALGSLSISGRVKMGISYLFQEKRIFSRLTVEENLKVAYAGKTKQFEMMLENVLDQYPVLRTKRKIIAGLLSGGEQQMLAIGRVLMQNPKLVLFDEPFSGLADVLVEETIVLIGNLASRGIACLIIEHQVEKIRKISDRHYYINDENVFEYERK